MEKTFHSAGCILFHPSAWGVPTLGLPVVHLFSQSHSSSGAVSSSKKSSLIIPPSRGLGALSFVDPDIYLCSVLPVVVSTLPGKLLETEVCADVFIS